MKTFDLKIYPIAFLILSFLAKAQNNEHITCNDIISYTDVLTPAADIVSHYWDFGDSTSSSNVGTYLVTVAHPSYCMPEAYTINVVEQPPIPTAIQGPTEACPSQPITYSVTGPDPAYNYIWSVGNGKYSGQDGHLIWYRFPQADGLTQAGYSGSLIYDIDIDPDGTMHGICHLPPGTYADGQFTTVDDGTYILRYDSSGNFLSGIKLDADINLYRTYQVQHNNFNNTYVISGYNFTSSASFGGQPVDDYFVACYDYDGNFLWLRTNNLAGMDSNGITDCHIDAGGNIYVTGGTRNGDIFCGYQVNTNTIYKSPTAFKLDPDGNLIWGSNATNVFAICNGEAITQNGDQVLVAGAMNGVTWGGLSYPGVVNAGYDITFAKIDNATGTVTGGDRLYSSFGNTEHANDLAVGPDGSYYLSGTFASDITVNGTILVSTGNTDFFIAKYAIDNNCSLGTQSFEKEEAVLYPNPAKGIVNLKITDASGFVIYDLLGHEVLKGSVSPAQPQIDISGIAAGTYVLRLASAKERNLRLVVE